MRSRIRHRLRQVSRQCNQYGYLGCVTAGALRNIIGQASLFPSVSTSPFVSDKQTPLMSNLDFGRAAELVLQADAIIVAAGAGMGVDSGLPDFRGNAGFWNAYPALAKANMDFTEVASPATFLQNPALAWGFYGHRLALYRSTVPHAGFGIVRKWMDYSTLGGRVFTSNVDGQFQKAGFAQDQIHECHGSIHHMQCMDSCESGVWRADEFEPEVDVENCLLVIAPPECPHCGGLARPNILMFGDWNWLDEREALQSSQESKWLNELPDSYCKLVVIEMGAGTAIPSVRRFSHRMSHQFGARIIRINPTEPQVPSSFDVGIALGSLESVQKIDAAITQNCTAMSASRWDVV